MGQIEPNTETIIGVLRSYPFGSAGLGAATGTSETRHSIGIDIDTSRQVPTTTENQVRTLSCNYWRRVV
jgi:hypothetical protein